MADQKKPKLALYPVYLYTDELPKTGEYYVVGSNGIFFHKENRAGSGLVKVDGIPWLEECSTNLTLNLPKVSGDIIATALHFFRKVFQKYHSESYVTLLYSQKLSKYRLWCPKQTVTAGSVEYDRSDQPSFEERSIDDWQMVGTIHSHCDFSAFHSGTDTHDESSFDGLHITLGHVNRDNFSMVSSIALNNSRKQLEPEDCVLGVVRENSSTFVHKTWDKAGRFELNLSDVESQQLAKNMDMIDNEWMQKVEKGGGFLRGSTEFHGRKRHKRGIMDFFGFRND